MRKSLNRLNLICILLLSLVLMSCRTVKETAKSETSIQEAVVNKIAASVETNRTTSSDEVSKVLESSTDSTETFVVEVLFSAPDTFKMQYPTRVTYTSTVGWKSNRSLGERKHEDRSQESSKTDVSAKANSSKNTEAVSEQSESKKPPNYQIIAAVVVLISLYVAYKKLPWRNFLKRISTLFK